MTTVLAALLPSVLDALLPVVASIVGAFLVKFLREQSAKLGLELSAQQEKRLQEVAVAAVMAVEEKAFRTKKAGGLVSSTDKHTAALQAVQEAALKFKVALNPQEASALVDGALPVLRQAVSVATLTQ